MDMRAACVVMLSFFAVLLADKSTYEKHKECKLLRPPRERKAQVEDGTEQQIKTQPKVNISSSWIKFDRYYSHSQINEYLAHLAETYPHLITLQNIGRSFDGRNMIFAKISSNPSAQKPIIVIDGAIHAREWISAAAVTYVLHQLLENGENSYLLEKLDWYIIPVLNPDGYEYSRTNDRLWRRSRSKGTKCYGVDLNRNFDFHWGATGVSSDECAVDYKGPRPNSEVEIRNFINFLTSYRRRIKLYLSFHSYSQCILHPWGDVKEPTENWNELSALGNEAAAAIRSFSGRNYSVGAAYSLEASSGTSLDYVYGALGVPLAYTVELPPRDDSEDAFELPPSEIKGVVEEAWVLVAVFGKYVTEKYGSI